MSGGTPAISRLSVSVALLFGIAVTAPASRASVQTSTPTIGAVTPSGGSTAGGTLVTINGTGFVSGAMVQFGQNNATQVTFVAATQLIAITPASTNQNEMIVAVSVVNPDGGTAVQPQAFSYTLPPAMSSVTPNNGPASGANVVTVSGQYFRLGATVSFGGTAASNVIFNNNTRLTVNVPTHAAGAVAVQVTNPDGQTASVANSYTFNPPPAITGLSPAVGSSSGGTVVTVSGSGFVNGAQVQFGVNNASSVLFVNATTLQAATPAASNQSDDSVVGVTVLNPDGQSAFAALAYGYHLVPSILSVTPASGAAAGGNIVTIAGANFRGAPSVPVVTFGSTPSPNVIFNSGTRLTVTAPPGVAGPVNVTVTDADAQSAALPNGYRYAASPTIAAVTPNVGSAAGGTAVTITGTNFVAGSALQVQFGVNNAAAATFVSATKITAVTPAASNQSNDSQVGVTVINGDGTQAFLPLAFSYHLPPSITSVGNNDGPPAGGGNATINGMNFRGLPSPPVVKFGNNISPLVVFNSGTTLTAAIPPGSLGSVPVTVIDADGLTATLPHAYHYVSTGIASITPNIGPATGSAKVTIAGFGFVSGAKVAFGKGTAPKTATWNSSSSLTVSTPAHFPATVDITVTNPSGASGSLPQAYTFTNGPAVYAISPDHASPQSNATITLTGANLKTVRQVLFGSQSAKILTTGLYKVTVTLPVSTVAGPVDVAVRDSNGTQVLHAGFTYSTAITNQTVDDANAGIPYSNQLVATGGVAPFTWSLVPNQGVLPPGLALSAGGLISGTPQAPSETAFSFTVQVQDSSTPPLAAQASYSMNVLYGFSNAPVPLSYFGMSIYDQATWPVGITVGELGKGLTVSWPFIQQSSRNAPYDWHILDAYVNAAMQHGVDINYTPFNFPPWAVPDPNKNCAAYNAQYTACTDMVSNIQDWQNFTTALVTRYKNPNLNIHLYELYNEPEVSPASFTGTVAQMVQLTTAFHDVIRAVDPAALIGSPSSSNDTYTRNYYNNGGTKDIDVVDLHFYPNVPVDYGPESILGARSVLPKQTGVHFGFTGKPFWETESSWGKDALAIHLSDPQQKAAWVARWLLLNWSIGMSRAYWYAWDDPTNGTLYDPVTGVTPAAIAYGQVQSWMLGANMQTPCSLNGGTQFHAIYTCGLYRQGGYQALAVWNTDTACVSGTCTSTNFTPPMAIYTQYRDVAGNVHAITPGQAVPVGARPILLENMTAPPPLP